MPDKTDIETFLAQVESHQNIVHKTSFLYSQSTSDREDLKQEILLQLWKSFPSFEKRSNFSTWMYRVALNTAISFKRKNSSGLRQTGSDPEQTAKAQQPANSDDLRDLHRAIAKLSKIEKAIIMQWLDERSYEEIADTMGMSVKNVSVRLVRIRNRLGQLVTEGDQT
ncbi:MAG: RNA polymerase sigma factor [Xanthomonadales bacterium]|nr:RNA polymerase sigma factor [Xanthomonadales bacterium]